MIWTFLLTKIGLPLLQLLAVVLAIIGLVLGIRQWGKNVERVEMLKRSLGAANDRQKIAASIDASTNDDFLRPPANRGLRSVSP